MSMYCSDYLNPGSEWLIKCRGLALKKVTIIEVQPYGLLVQDSIDSPRWVALWYRIEALLNPDAIEILMVEVNSYLKSERPA